jgi:pimeloyl-ACP methyl ester carboxylesterase
MTMGLPLPKRRVLERVGIARREIAAYAKQAWLLRHDVARPVLPRNARPGDQVVVCLHGLFASAGVMRPLRKRIERHDGVHTATMSYRPGPSIRTLAGRLQELLGELPDRVDVHLVGHSLGGVVARWFAQEIGDSRVVQTISLATPYAGVSAARWLDVELAKELHPQSALLRTLQMGSRRALGVPHLSLVAENDQVISGAPMSHALVGGDVTLIRRCGHNAMLFHDEAIAHVERRVLAFRPPR